jgi:hypothetical protein
MVWDWLRLRCDVAFHGLIGKNVCESVGVLSIDLHFAQFGGKPRWLGQNGDPQEPSGRWWRGLILATLLYDRNGSG